MQCPPTVKLELYSWAKAFGTNHTNLCLQAFDSVVDLVEYHKGEPLVLKSGGETTLKYECPP